MDVIAVDIICERSLITLSELIAFFVKKNNSFPSVNLRGKRRNIRSVEANQEEVKTTSKIFTITPAKTWNTSVFRSDGNEATHLFLLQKQSKTAFSDLTINALINYKEIWFYILLLVWRSDYQPHWFMKIYHNTRARVHVQTWYNWVTIFKLKKIKNN